MEVRRLKKLLILLCLSLLVGCGEQPLTVRSTLEGDSYLRKNSQALSEEQFLSLSSEQQLLGGDDYELFKNLMKEHVNTRYLLIDDRIYRYSQSDKLLYVADWVEEEGEYKLNTLVFQ